MTSLPPLTRAQLSAIRRDRRGVVAVPDDALLDLPERAVQFGTGAFLRGFVDDFLNRANVAGLFGGRVVAVGSTGSGRDRALRDQDGLYTLVADGIEAGQVIHECRVISSVSRALSAAHEWREVLAVARTRSIRFVFSNTTEVGIALDAADAPDATPPRSFPAKLTRFLLERAREFDYEPSAGVIVLPCELIERNGDRLRSLVRELAARWTTDDRFTSWVETSVHFCNTLVDRIVPGRPHGAHAERLLDMLGYHDAMLTTCESYRLFAIEGDDALREQMPWTSADPAIVVTPDIALYRERKVRLLNGAHTMLVPPALLLGCETVRESVTHPALGRLVRHAMLDEIAPTVEAEGAVEFAEQVLERFRNPFIQHALVDITLQATMKMRVRVVPSIVRYAALVRRVPQSLAFGFAAFLLLMRGDWHADRRARGLPVPADDGADRLLMHWTQSGGNHARLARAVCADVQLWGTDLSAVAGFVDAVAEHLHRADDVGVAAALDHHLATPVT